MTGFGRYTLENLAAGLQNPRIFLGEVSRLGTELNVAYHRLVGSERGTHVMKEDWDNLVILDACRFDTFERRNTIPGDVQQRRSLGSDSWEFLRENFAGGTFHDTVYVTANPYATRLPEGTFHAVVDLLDDAWDPERRTVLPETVVDAARDAFDRYPNKRLIVHFMQPHYPFIGEAGDRLEHTGLARPGDDERADAKRHVWGSLRHGRIPRERVVEAYRENLDIVLPHVETLLESLSGKSVVSADHGNLLGERTSPLPVRGYGHPRGLDSPSLRTVPWLVVDGADRRSVVAEPPVETDGPSEQVVERRLEALGYR